MPDWFSDTVQRVADNVVASKETKDRLAHAKLVHPPADADLREAAVKSGKILRDQLPDLIAAVQEIQDQIDKFDNEALPAEWQNILAAQDRLRRAQDPRFRRTAASFTPKAPGRFDWLWRRWSKSASNLQPESEVQAASEALTVARNAYTQAWVDKNIRQLEPRRRLEAVQAGHMSELEKSIYPVLMRGVNGAIDELIEASYEKIFSYAGTAELTDFIVGEVAQPVNAEAYRTIGYQIENVGSGAIGVAGPRGSGKSTLLNRFATIRTERDEDWGQSRVESDEDWRQSRVVRQWGICVSAPTKYDQRDFLLHLFGRLCAAVLEERQAKALEERLTNARPPVQKILPALRFLVFGGGVVLACFGVIIALRTAKVGGSSHGITDLTIAGCFGIVSLAAIVFPARLFINWPDESIFYSREMQEKYYSNRLDVIFRIQVVVALVCCAAFLTLLGLVLAGAAPVPGYVEAGGLGIAGAVGIGIGIIMWPYQRLLAERQRMRERQYSEPQVSGRQYPEPRAMAYSRMWPYSSDVRTAAADWYTKVKFQQSFTTGWSGTVTVSASSIPIQAQGGSSGSTQVTPLGMSTPEIVAAIKSFTKDLANSHRENGLSTARIPVVIGIDEIDKIDDPQEAQAFLNQIKGLFDDPNCLYLISISDDAMAAFERRGIPFRDAFDSSLSSVVALSYLSRDDARTITGSRLVGVQEPVADLLFVLAGGLPRDLVRLIRRAVEAKGQGKLSLDELIIVLADAEVEAKKKSVMARGNSLDGCPAKGELLAWASRRNSKPVSPEEYFRNLLDQAARLINSSADVQEHHDFHSKSGAAASGTCVAGEMAAFVYWLVTVGQVFSECSNRTDFEKGELRDNERSFERLAEAWQCFSLGPYSVLAMTSDIREAWHLPDVQSVQPKEQNVVAMPPVAS